MLEICKHNNKMCVIDMSIHIGEAIKARAEELSIGASEMGRKIGRTRGAIYALYENAHIRTDQLEEMCEILDYNFFALLSKEVKAELPTLNEPQTTYGETPPEEKERVGVTFFVDVDNMDEFRTEFKEFLNQKKAS